MAYEVMARPAEALAWWVVAVMAQVAVGRTAAVVGAVASQREPSAGRATAAVASAAAQEGLAVRAVAQMVAGTEGAAATVDMATADSAVA